MKDAAKPFETIALGAGVDVGGAVGATGRSGDQAGPFQVRKRLV